MTGSFKFCTANVRGLNNVTKRLQVFAWLHSLNASFYFLQEAHCTPACENDWSRERGGDIYFSHGTSNSRGVCILCNPHVSFSLVDIQRDTDGRVIIMNAIFSNLYPLTLVNVYAPNKDDPSFFADIKLFLNDPNVSNIIWAGDFNLVMDLDLDKKGGLSNTHFRSRNTLRDIMYDYNLVDTWRYLYPDKPGFTWYSKVTVGICCRLDFFFVKSSPH